MFEKTVLPGGVRVVTAALPHSYSTAISLYFGTGSRHEDAAVSGVSHYLEHMLFKGTESRPSARAVSETVEGVGGVLNAGTGREYTVYWTKLPAEHGRRGMELLADMVQRSLLLPAEVERERGVILEEIKGREDAPGRLAGGMIDALLWPGRPLGREVTGSEETVRAITPEHLRDHVARHYRTGNLVVACAGPASHGEVVAWASDLLREVPPGAGPMAAPAVASAQSRVALAGKPVKQATFCLGFPALSYEDPRRYALSVLDALLGGGMSGRLFLEVRERRGLAYSVGCYAQQYADDGSFVVHAGVAPAALARSLAAVREQLRRVSGEPLSPDELARLKRYIRGRTVMGLEGSRGVVQWGGRQELLRGRIREMEDVLADIEAVTAEDVRELAADTFAHPPCLSVVGPFEDEREIEGVLVDAG